MPPYRIDWDEKAQADIRAIDRSVAMRLFEGVFRFAQTGTGDVKILHGGEAGASRLRIGDYRVIFTLEEGVMRIAAVRHRSQVYR
jgi:mRNA interferase RelE/StbE